jgi:ubiquinol-cytochrome c reductase cytochrome c subunit
MMKTSIVAIVAVMAMAVAFSAVCLHAQPAPQAAPESAVVGSAANGRRLFSRIGCSECHGLEAQGATQTGAPRLGPDPMPSPAFVRYVRRPKGEMPPYTDKVVSDQDMADLYAFVKALPHPPDPKTLPFPK